MKVVGFTFIRNAVQNDYAIREAIASILPICDEVVVALGQSNDDTLGLIQSMQEPKINIIETVWDDTQREGGKVFALETNKALAALPPDTDWAFYIQGDECVHEEELPLIRAAMEAELPNKEVEGLLFHYRHFYGSYDYEAISRRWYRREIRIVRPAPGLSSYRDAQGFRLQGRKLRVKLIPAHIHHYGWVKPAQGLQHKVKNFHQFYHDEAYMQAHYGADYTFDYGNADRLYPYEGSHPKVMQERVARQDWHFVHDPKRMARSMGWRRRLLQKITDWTGWRIGEYKNYDLIS